VIESGRIVIIGRLIPSDSLGPRSTSEGHSISKRAVPGFFSHLSGLDRRFGPEVMASQAGVLIESHDTRTISAGRLAGVD
jgi:hypothetical protein